MLDAMRRSARSMGMKFILMMIVVTFVFMGAGSFLARNPDEVAKVNGEPIMIEDLQREYTNIAEALRRQFGGNLDEDLLRMLNLEQQALNSLIDKKILMQVADEKALRVPDEALADRITGISAFQTNGRFDREKYNQLLSQNRLTARQFETMQKELILLEQVQNLVTSSVPVSETEARAWFDWEYTEVNVDYVAFSPEDFKDIEISDEDISNYYEANKENYRIPDQIKTRYIRFNPKDFVDKADISDETVAAYIASNEIEDETGDETRDLLARRKAGDIAFERAMEMYDISFDGDDLVENAERLGYELETTDFFTREKGPATIRNSRQFADEAFELAINDISEIVEIDGVYYLIQPVERKEAHIADLSDVKAEVAEGARAEKMLDAAKNEAAAFLETLQESGLFAEAAQSQALSIASTGYFARNDLVPGIGRAPEFSRAAFELKETGSIYDSAVRVSDKFVVIRLADKIIPEEARFLENKNMTMQRLAARKQQETLENWMANLRRNSDIKISDRFTRQFN
jgi:peptidyl-prolyl cis-trans isomerase D